MSTYKEYINEFGKIISSQQASQLDDYDEKFYENDRVKNITHYWDSEIQFITVHIYPDEDVSTVLSSLTEPDMEYSIAKDLESSKDWEKYQNKIDEIDRALEKGMIKKELIFLNEPGDLYDSYRNAIKNNGQEIFQAESSKGTIDIGFAIIIKGKGYDILPNMPFKY